MRATYSAKEPPRFRTARPSAFSKGSRWRVRSASFRIFVRTLGEAKEMHRRMRVEPAIRVSRRVLADLEEISENVRAELCVLDLRVELQAEQGPVSMPHRLDAAVRRAGEGGEARRDLRHLVVVGLPHLELVGKSFEQDVRLVDLDDGLAKLRDLRRSRCASEVGRHELVACADPKDGSGEGVEVFAVLAHLLRIDADPGGTSGEDESVDLLQIGDGRVVRYDLRVDSEVLQHAPFSVRPLTSVVDDVDAHAYPVAAGRQKAFRGRRRVTPIRSSREACSRHRTRLG